MTPKQPDPAWEPPRRTRIDLATPPEKAIRDALAAVEGAGADIRLTDASVLLIAALERVADWVDGVDGQRTVPRPYVESAALDARIDACRAEGLLGAPPPAEERPRTFDEWIKTPEADEVRLGVCKTCGQSLLAPAPAESPAVPVEELRRLVTALEDEAARYGTAAGQPLGVLMGPPGDEKPHTRRNRHILWGMSGGMNKAAERVLALCSASRGTTR